MFIPKPNGGVSILEIKDFSLNLTNTCIILNLSHTLSTKCYVYMYRYNWFIVDVDLIFNQDLRLFSVGITVRYFEGFVLQRDNGWSYGRRAWHLVEPIKIYTDSFLAARLITNLEEVAQLLRDDVLEILEKARDNFFDRSVSYS